MPGARKAGKVKTTFWLMEEQRDRLHELAKMSGVTMTDMFKEMLDAYSIYKGITINVPKDAIVKSKRLANAARTRKAKETK